MVGLTSHTIEEQNMDEQEVRWEHYPRVANHAAAHAFVERLVLKGKRPKTVDADARGATRN